MMSDLESRLSEIESSLDEGTYDAGPWQRFTEAASQASLVDRRLLESAVTRVSEKLHRRGGRSAYRLGRAKRIFQFEF